MDTAASHCLLLPRIGSRAHGRSSKDGSRFVGSLAAAETPDGKPATSGSGWHEQPQASEKANGSTGEDDERCVEVFRFGRLLFTAFTVHRSAAVWTWSLMMMMMMALMTTFDEASRGRAWLPSQGAGVYTGSDAYNIRHERNNTWIGVVFRFRRLDYVR